MSECVGIVGVGLVGSAFSHHLLQAGFEVRGFDLDERRLGAELARRGIRFLDACVSGTSAMAWKKDLIVIAGGTVEDFEAARPLFAGFARAAYRMGVVGSRSRRGSSSA